jgi:hypothetical protein
VTALGFEEVGRSTEGRPIVARRFGGPGSPLLLMGGIHGDEPASVDALLELVPRNVPARSFRTDHAPGYSPGPAPLSEPETRAIATLIERDGLRGAVAVHAPFACVNFDGPATDWAQAVARACGWPAQADIGYPTPGSFGSWLGRDRGIPVLTLELPPGPLAGFRLAAAAALEAALRAAPV